MTGQYVVMYSEKGSSAELFSQPGSYEDAKWSAGYFERQGYEVIAVITAEHAQERKGARESHGEIEGSHLWDLLDSIVDRFTRNYPGVARKTALEAVVRLCTWELQGEKGLQAALLDEIHRPVQPGVADWRTDMQFSIRNRRPEGDR